MLAIERRQNIVERIRKEQKVHVSNLSQLFSVTEETIRRDLEKLENEGILTRTYGGAVLSQHTNEDLPFPTRTSMNHEIKQAIAQKAADLINDGDTIMVDASTTCLELIYSLKGKKNLTIITNSVKIAHDFIGSNPTIISTGGTLRAHSLALTGPIAHSTIKNYYVDMAIISCKGLSLDKGMMESNEPEGDLKKSMIKQAAKVILLADHTKFNKTAFIKLFGFENVDYVITDIEPDSEWIDLFQKHSIQVLY
ncbi:MAG: transcriptional regulator, DeoR family [Firmicutes bacterium]|nr:transcriptional regulator, DeoR family [Bacillota bacterium]